MMNVTIEAQGMDLLVTEPESGKSLFLQGDDVGSFLSNNLEVEQLVMLGYDGVVSADISDEYYDLMEKEN